MKKKLFSLISALIVLSACNGINNSSKNSSTSSSSNYEYTSSSIHTSSTTSSSTSSSSSSSTSTSISSSISSSSSKENNELIEISIAEFLSRKDSPLSDKKHLTLAAALKYPNNVTLARNVLIFGDGNLVNYNYWNQHFSLESLEKEVREAGFTIENVYGDVNGREYVAEEESFAVVLKKK